MDPENFLEPEVAVTAAVIAAICSPRLRHLLRRGLVYGTAGVLMAGDAVTSFARNAGNVANQAGAATTQATQEGVQQAQETAPVVHNNQHSATRKARRRRTKGQGG